MTLVIGKSAITGAIHSRDIPFTPTRRNRWLDPGSDIRDHYTFSQRYGYDPLPAPMKPGEMSRELRRKLCNCILHYLRESADPSSRDLTFGTAATVVRNALGRFTGTPANQVPLVVDFALERFEEYIMGGRGDRVLTLPEFLLNEMAPVTRERAAQLAAEIRRAFEVLHAPYVLDERQASFRFFLCASGEQAAAMRRALESLHEGGFLGATRHLRDAAEHTAAGRHAEAVARSIHAVEAVACKIDPEARQALASALRSLERDGILPHSELTRALEKLFGYTSDKRGNRRPLIFGTDAGLAESLFMVGVSASLSAYLAQKHGQTAEPGT